MVIKAVIYDCDGVLVDSGEVILSYYNWMMSKCGLPELDWTLESLKQKALSLADRDLLEYLSNGDAKLYERMLDVSRNEEKDPAYNLMKLETGILETLDWLKRSDIPLGVVTNRGKSLYKLLDYFNIGDYFKISVTSHDVVKPKPDPEGLLKLCSFFNAEPDEVLFLGDSPTDYHAAKSCGMNFIAFKKELWGSKMITDHREIIGKVEKA